MRTLIALLLSLWLAPAWAQLPMTGAGKGTPGAAAYQGPGDIVASATAWGSCARVYTAAQASTSTSLCDLVAVTGGAAVCTLRGSSTGYVDLAASYCASTTPSAACAAASGGSCKVTKVYDQTGNGNHWTQATLGSMPALTFSALNSLPGMTFVTANNQTLAKTSFTLAQPFSITGVYKRTGTFTSDSGILSENSNTLGLYASISADNAAINAGTRKNQAATDNAFHAAQGVLNGASSVLAVDGSNTGSVDAGTNAFSATTIRIGRGAGTLDGVIMEVGIWPVAFNSTQYGNINTNAHSSTSGYNF